MQHRQAMNWARLADAVGKRYPGGEDLVQNALLNVLEHEDQDVLDRVWRMREGMRSTVQDIIQNAHEDVDDWADNPDINDYLLGPDEAVDQSWLDMADNKVDTLEARIRDAYDDPDIAEQAIAAQQGTPHRWVEDRYKSEMAALEEVEADRKKKPIYMRPAHALDYDLVELAAESFALKEEHTLGWCDDESEVLDVCGQIGQRAVKSAYEMGLTSPEAAVLVNRIAGKVADVTSVHHVVTEPYKAKRYGATRIGGGDWMALCEGRRSLHAEGPVNNPGITSGYDLEDEQTWAALFPQGWSDERFTLPAGDPSTVQAFVNHLDARTSPEDTDWQLWDTKEARQAHAAKALGLTLDLQGRAHVAEPASWKVAALAGRKAFWNAGDHIEKLRRNGKALWKAGLTRDPSLGYKVVPRNGIRVKSLRKSGVTDHDGAWHPFSSGPLTLIVRKDKKDSFLEALGETNVGEFNIATI